MLLRLCRCEMLTPCRARFEETNQTYLSRNSENIDLGCLGFAFPFYEIRIGRKSTLYVGLLYLLIHEIIYTVFGNFQPLRRIRILMLPIQEKIYCG